jgi:hypothetical protein
MRPAHAITCSEDQIRREQNASAPSIAWLPRRCVGEDSDCGRVAIGGILFADQQGAL